MRYAAYRRVVLSSLLVTLVAHTAATAAETLVGPMEPMALVSVEAANRQTVIGEATYLVESGQTRQAQAVLNAALARGSSAQLSVAERIQAYQLLARIAADGSQYDVAQQYLAKALKLSPNNATTVTEQAWVWAQQASDPFVAPSTTARQRAQELFTQAKPLIKTSQEQTLWDLRQQQWATRQKNFTTLPTIPMDASPSADGGLTQAELARLTALVTNPQTPVDVLKQTAYPVILMGLETRPTDPALLELLAQTFGRLNQPSQAITYGLAALQQRQTRWPAMQYFVATQYKALGDTVNAIRLYEQVLQASPQHEPTLLALGELSLGQGNVAQADIYYGQAIQLNPAVLDNLLQKAQAAYRQENTAEAARQMERVRQLSGERYPVIHAEALHGLVNTAFMDAFYQQPSAPITAEARADLQQLANSDPLIQNDWLKLQWIEKSSGQTTHTALMGQLQQQATAANPLVAGEALYLLKRYVEANRMLDTVDGETSRGYLAIGDRLLALHALTAAGIMYQRGYEMEPLPELADGQRVVTEKRHLAEQRLEQGNAAYRATNYPQAIQYYLDATRLYPDWDVPHLRLGDVYEASKQPLQAYAAYHNAVTLNPAYLTGKPFVKKYQRLEKQYLKATQQPANGKKAR